MFFRYAGCIYCINRFIITTVICTCTFQSDIFDPRDTYEQLDNIYAYLHFVYFCVFFVCDLGGGGNLIAFIYSTM